MGITLADLHTAPREFAEPDPIIPATEPSAPSPTPAEAEPVATPAPVPDVDPSAPAVVPPAPAVTEPEPAAIEARQPLTFNTGGRTIAITGSYVTPEGDAVIPKALIKDAMRHLGLGMHHETVYPELQRREAEARRAIANAETAVSEAEVKFTSLGTKLAERLQTDENLRAYLGPDIQQWILQAEIEARDHRIKAFEDRGKPSAEQQVEQQRTQATAGMTDVLAAAAQAPAYAAMMADPMYSQKVYGRLMRRAGTIVKVDNGTVTRESVAVIDAELADLLDDFKERQTYAPPKPQNGTAAALRAAVSAPAPAKAPSITTNSTQPRNEKGRYANMHPDAPPEVFTNIDARREWIELRQRQGLPFMRED